MCSALFKVRGLATLQRAFSHASRLEAGPLSGVRVVDLTRVLAGPYATQVLGDLGADVVKIEHPTRGDDTRAWGPPFSEGGESAYYLCANRNKRSIGLDFRTPAGQTIVRKLAEDAHIFVENFIPGGLAKYGLDYHTLSKINPCLVYVSISGYGQTGPYSKRPGYDVMVEAEFGFMHITGHADGPPAKAGVAVTDLTTGLYAVIGSLAALREAERTGKGQHIDAALSDCQVALLANIASSVLISGKRDQGRQGTAHPSIVPYQTFDTKDGSIMLGSGNDTQFLAICDALQHPEWKSDERFTTNSLRVKHRAELIDQMQSVLGQKTTAEWMQLWGASPFPYAPINDVKDTLEHPQTVARKMVTETPHPTAETVKLVSSPLKLSETPAEIRRAPPLLGEHTQEILREAGYTPEEIEALLENKVVA